MDKGRGDGADPLGWAVLADVDEVTFHGPDGSTTELGLKHFAPGAKVWLLPPLWGDGWESAVVVGRHRGSGRYVQMVTAMKHLHDFRVAAVYSPAVVRELTRPLHPGRGEPRQWLSEAEALETIARHPLTSSRLQ